MREVRALYRFLRRNYRDGDKIYAFGFSRGAFTIRLLVTLVGKCGLIQTTDENQLFHFPEIAYKAFRRDFLQRARRGYLARVFVGLMTRPSYRPGTNEQQIDLRSERLNLYIETVRPDITFLGLWDTVDAYGMPVDELKQGIDQWIWPMSLADRRLSPIVKQACHALSLDDERPTFRPVLWDESQGADQARIEQVWFAGVHANVGGGYPIDDLAYVPLVWMLKRAAAAGMRFDPGQLAYFSSMRNVHGTAYESRSGVASYYRYGPRSLAKLCADTKNGVFIAQPKIDDSVLERIAARHVAYAPLSLPANLPLLNPRDGTSVLQNVAYVDLAWDTAFWRRITYFATLMLTFVLVILPLTASPLGPANAAEAKSKTITWLSEFLPTPLVNIGSRLFGFMPSWATPWTDALQAHPYLAFALVTAFVWLFVFESAQLQRNICERSEWAWAAMKGNTTFPAPRSGWADRFIRKVRTSSRLNGFARVYDETIIPNVFGILALALIGYAAYVVVRAFLHVIQG